MDFSRPRSQVDQVSFRAQFRGRSADSIRNQLVFTAHEYGPGGVMPNFTPKLVPNFTPEVDADIRRLVKAGCGQQAIRQLSRDHFRAHSYRKLVARIEWLGIAWMQQAAPLK